MERVKMKLFVNVKCTPLCKRYVQVEGFKEGTKFPTKKKVRVSLCAKEKWLKCENYSAFHTSPTDRGEICGAKIARPQGDINSVLKHVENISSYVQHWTRARENNREK